MEVTRIFDLIPHYLENNPNQDTVFGYKRDGEWKKMSIKEYAQKTDNISYALLKLGIEAGDKVAIICGNRPEWNIIDMATQQIQAISVPIYPTISQDDYRYILNHAEIKLVFIEGKELRTKIEPILDEIQTLKYIYTLSDQGKYPYFDQMLKLGEENPQPELLQKLKDSTTPDDVATMIYTSGTTGKPKGVMLTHNNIVQQINGIIDIFGPKITRTLSFLPLCHAYERLLVYAYQHRCISTYYAESIGTIVPDIKRFCPHMMTCVPRVLEKIHDKILSSGKKLPKFKKKLYFWAYNLACQYENENRSCWYNLRYSIADKLIYKKWREAIGGDFDIIVSGGSMLPVQLSRFFSAIKMPIYEGYGLSETSPVIAVSRRNQRRAGYVGPALPGVEVKIGENNEIICRGHNVMKGYYKDEEKTKEAIDADGWFHTGDSGEFDENGLLKITGRIKNLFKTSSGKYVNPEVIENICKESLYIENIVVFGENQKYVVALVIPNFEELGKWAKENNITYSSKEELANNKDVNKFMLQVIKEYNQNFGEWEQIKKIKLLADEWNMSNNIITPTLKVKRPIVQKKYEKEIAQLFE